MLSSTEMPATNIVKVKEEPLDWEQDSLEDSLLTPEGPAHAHNGVVVDMEEKTGVSTLLACKQEIIDAFDDDPIELPINETKTEPVDYDSEGEAASESVQSDNSTEDYYNEDNLEDEEEPDGDGNEVNTQETSKKSNTIYCPHCIYTTNEKFLLNSHMRLFHKHTLSGTGLTKTAVSQNTRNRDKNADKNEESSVEPGSVFDLLESPGSSATSSSDEEESVVEAAEAAPVVRKDDTDSDDEIFPVRFAPEPRKSTTAASDEILDLPSLKDDAFSKSKQSLVANGASGIDLHIGNYKPIKAKISCPHCLFTVSDKSLLKPHILNFHKKEVTSATNAFGELRDIFEESVSPQFICTHAKCGYSAPNGYSLNRHLVSVHRDVSQLRSESGVYACDICQYMTLSVSDLKKHLVVHSEERAFACDICGYASKTERALNNHRVSVHRDPRIIESRETFKCDLCPFISMEQGQLTKHMRRHDNVKPYACTQCNYATNKRDVLLSHLVTMHKDVSKVGYAQVHKCDACDYMTTHTASFRRHLQTH